MAAPTPQYVRDLSLTGEFDLVTDSQINNVILDEVIYHYESMTTEDLYTRVVGLHTAHILKLALVAEGGGGGGQGDLIAVKVGPLEKRFGQSQQAVVVGEGLDMTTSYGRRCLALLTARLPSVRTTY